MTLAAEQTVHHVLALRRIAGAVADPTERGRLERVERALQRSIGVGVPKRKAAALLGVSVQGLEPWIDRGLLPAVHVPGSSRELVDREALVVLAEEVSRLRAGGLTRGVLAAAFRELEQAGRLPRKLRPNEPARALRRAYLATTPAERLHDVAELSYTAGVLAAHRAGKLARA
jgi:hypothetical protein